MSANESQDIHNQCDSQGDSQGDELLDELLPDSARDLLISRVIDGRASSRDWDRFRALAAHEPAVWCELADTQTQHEAVRQELSGVIAIADRVELPVGPADDSHTRLRLSLVSKWGGWAAAAALLLVWSLGNPATQHIGNDQSGTQTAGIPMGNLGSIGLVDAEPEQAFEQYLSAGQKTGRVIAEMPEQVVVETRPMPDGTIEVLYLRQIIERRVIDQAYRQVLDERGNTVAVPVRVQRNTRGVF